MQLFLRTVRQFAAASICLMVIGAMAGTNTVFADDETDPISLVGCPDSPCCVTVGAACSKTPAECNDSCPNYDCTSFGCDLR
jgi:hypothetical protein